MNNTYNTTTISQFFLWVGASVSIAEIVTGSLLAPLGLTKGIQAILIGHVIGAIILFLSAWISANSRVTALQATRISFGTYGSYGLTTLNMLQLVGWASVMIATGSIALNGISKELFAFDFQALWSLLIGAILVMWVLFGLKKISKLNIVAVTILFGFTIVLASVIFGGGGVGTIPDATMKFSTAVELSAVMSLSWLPLIGDYTRHVKHQKMGTVMSVLGYSVGSTFMFIIGLGGSLYVGSSDISAILMASGLGVVALMIVLLSTVLTTFLDSYSAGVNFKNLVPMANERFVSVIFTLLAVVIAIAASVSAYESFLYFIGSVFAPLYGILFADYYLLKRRHIDPQKKWSWQSALLWLLGVVIYHVSLKYPIPLGHTLWVLVGVFIVRIAMVAVIERKNVFSKVDLVDRL
ncbi:putative hydroxymethylpyrimidine transporter CytX [Viridibacillus sp. YIM B01967]|uniref:Hydroxymethylpyrimidine transporter CytX n=1 Tax=Viridibacillus soli TaxID=2798301 RepID=A0ABS1H9K2_9BACL|nr:putative hydroxymethylpyrimidine transporter CytX [Viridibacillus soli]MBK3496100.1 putative hydroxymethylpyrimidine transporter CytX [Viridibacillus soli]